MSTRTAWWSCLVLIGLCLAVGLQTVRRDNYFLGDDFGLVQHLHDLPVHRFAAYFAADWTEGIYGSVLDELRPFLAISYWLDARLFGPVNVAGYHATNVVLHILNTLLVLAIARSIAPREPMFAVLAAALFALMPSHAEPIAWISGRVDSIAAPFYLGAFLCFVRFRRVERRRWLAAALLAFACGLFAKQSVVTLPVLLIAFDLVRPIGGSGRLRPFDRIWPHIPFVAVAALYVILRHALFGNALREDLVTVAAVSEFIGRQDRYMREMLPSPNSAPRLVRTGTEVVTVLIVLACVRWVVAGRAVFGNSLRRVAFFGVAWYGITIAPMIVTYVSARHLYITAAGVSIAMAAVVLPAGAVEDGRRRTTRAAMAATLIALYAIAAIWNVQLWVASGLESQRFASALARVPQSVPRGTTVLVSVPEFYRGGWFWSWATPFAVQPPFTGEDMNQAYRIVERPPTYCCPVDQWWAARKDAVAALLDAPAAQDVLYVEFVPDGTPRVTKRRVDGQRLRRRIDAVLGKPLQAMTAMAPDDAAEVARVLFEPE
jgi:hypothetical protein